MAKIDDESPLLGNPKVEASKSKLYIKDYVAALVAIFMIGLGIAGIVTVCVYQTQILYEYGVVLDAGSSHTNLMVYRWPKKDVIGHTGLVEQVGQCTSQGGSISSYSEKTPSMAGDSLKSCIDNTAKKLIPTYLHHKSCIFLGATAGMRLLEKQDKTVANTIMESVRRTLSNSKFKFEDDYARIISGEEEGLSSWVTVNYLTGKILYRKIHWNSIYDNTDTQLAGALDMGGASTQITFPLNRTNTIPSNYVRHLSLYGKQYPLYTHSYLCYGKNEADKRYMALLLVNEFDQVSKNLTVDDPCSPAGLVEEVSIKYITQSPCVDEPSSGWHFNSSNVTFRGVSNVTQCYNLVQRLFNFTNCSPKNCSFNGVYEPSTTTTHFVAFSSFYYLVNDLNMTGLHNLTLAAFRDVADRFCKKSWAQIAKEKSSKESKMYKKVCLDAQFIYTLLRKGYHISDNRPQVQFINRIKDRSLGWALGFMINATNSIPDKVPEYRVKTEIFLAVIIVGSILIALGTLLLIMTIRRRWRPYSEMRPLVS